MNPKPDLAQYVIGMRTEIGQCRAMECLPGGAVAIVASKSWWWSREDIWTFANMNDAARAWVSWGTLEPEPNGWIRHQPSNRRRAYRSDNIHEWVEP